MSRTTAADAAIAIVSAGAVTCVGLSAASTCAAIRASLDGFEETHFVDQIGEPLLGAMVPDESLGLDAGDPGTILGGTGKLAAMFVRAATECVRAAGGVDAARTALLLVGPEHDRQGVTTSNLQQCFAACEAAVGRAFHPSSQITQIGSPGLAVALERARQLLSVSEFDARRAEQLKPDAVLIAGLDSYLNTEDIDSSLRRGRLLAGGTSDGYIPGEAAACVLVTRVADVPAIDALGQPRPAILHVAGAGLGAETQTLDSDRPSRGAGMAAAMREALTRAGMQAEHMHICMSDTSAESYFFEDASYAWSRLLRDPSPPHFLTLTPSNRVGHIGAAMGLLMVALALDGARKAWAPGANTLLQLSTAGSDRGAVVLSTL